MIFSFCLHSNITLILTASHFTHQADYLSIHTEQVIIITS